MEKDETI